MSISKEQNTKIDAFCDECQQVRVGSSVGFITGCEHYPIIAPCDNAGRRTSFLELVMKHQATDNPVTKSSYSEIIKKRVDARQYG